jgi:hypothetical protein
MDEHPGLLTIGELARRTGTVSCGPVARAGLVVVRMQSGGRGAVVVWADGWPR